MKRVSDLGFPMKLIPFLIQYKLQVVLPLRKKL